MKKFANFWGKRIRDVLDPRELVSGVICGCRLAWSCVRRAALLGTPDTPAGIGDDRLVVTIPLANISNFAFAAGDTIPEGTKIGAVDQGKTYRFRVVGLPTGLVLIGSSANGKIATVYGDFIERDGTYFFKSYPTQFGVVNTKSGGSCTFVCVRSTPGSSVGGMMLYQYNTPDFHINATLRKVDSDGLAVMGNTTTPAYLACGVDRFHNASDEDELLHQWREGGVLLSLTKQGQLLRDYVASDTSATPRTPTPGKPITDSVHTRMVIYREGGELQCGFPETTTSPEVVKASLQGITTFNTSYNDWDVRSHKALDARINKNSKTFIAQLLTPDFGQDKPLLCDSETTVDNTKLAVYVVASTHRPTESGLSSVSITGRDLVFSTKDTNAVVRIPLTYSGDDTADTYVGVSDSGDQLGLPLSVGMWITDVFLAVMGENFRNDVILKHVSINEIFTHTGSCIVVKPHVVL